MGNYRAILGLIVLLSSGLCLADNGGSGPPDNGSWDKRVFMKGSTVTVLLNYDQFLYSGIVATNPTLTRKNVEASVMMAMDRWVQVTSLNLKVNYGGLTTKVEPDEGEILVGAWPDNDRDGQFAAAWPSETDEVTNGRCPLRFFANTDGFENEWAVFNFANYPAGTGFISAVIMHEMGHCFGLHHNPDDNSLNTVMHGSGISVHSAYGPFIEDVEDIVAMYGTRGRVQLDVVRSTNDGASWSSINPSMPILGITQTPVLHRDNQRMVMFFTDRNHRPNYIMADAEGRTWDSAPTPITNVRSLYGTTGSGSDNEYMWGFVNPDDDDNYVNILYTSDAGAHWEGRDPGFRAASTPSIRKIDNDTWIISYLHLDENRFKNENGRIMTRISTDDGRTWRGPYELAPGLRAIGGVTVSSLDRSRIRIGFVRTSDGDDRWTTNIATIAAHLNSNNSITRDNWVSDTTIASTSDTSFTATSRVFVQAYQTPWRRLTSCNNAFDVGGWQRCGFVNAFSYRGMPPAVGARPNSNLVYMVKEK